MAERINEQLDAAAQEYVYQFHEMPPDAPVWNDSITNAFKAGHASRDAEVKALVEALEDGVRMFQKAYDNAKMNADNMEAEFRLRNPGLQDAFHANHWRAAELHILMCMSGFKSEMY